MLAALTVAAALLGLPGWAPDARAADAFASGRGQVAFAVRTDRGLWGRGLDRVVPSASVVKALLLVAYLRHPGVRGRPLRRDERDLLAPMIRRSDNASADALVVRLGRERIEGVARARGMPRFRLRVPWGASEITAREQTRFLLRIDAAVPARHRPYALRLLRTVVPSQRWGLARVVPPGWTLFFKGGWGSRSGAVDHQVGLLRRGGVHVAVAVLTTGQGSHAYGERTLRGVARRLLRGLGRVAGARP